MSRIEPDQKVTPSLSAEQPAQDLRKEQTTLDKENEKLTSQVPESRRKVDKEAGTIHVHPPGGRVEGKTEKLKDVGFAKGSRRDDVNVRES